MTLEDEVKSILEQNETRPLDALQRAQELLRDAVKPGGRFDPLKTDTE
jgi:hypothetical protein